MRRQIWGQGWAAGLRFFQAPSFAWSGPKMALKAQQQHCGLLGRSAPDVHITGK
jgi:hypothetical protein